ncbi:hypothetical protein BLNAU_1022 [Blattamonas nauphoetae]|uniref:Uncharacterized protein n=1 Tax=Blattamonas nauphoetae TaxID=2049346 RepID=A0ABQ9YJK6_9EUKA|nr:hypothetical protein BLNAU_1022 [Blattamonas nauphoetae]
MLQTLMSGPLLNGRTPACPPLKGNLLSFSEKTVVFQSLVATVKFQPVLDDTLEVQAVKFLQFVTPYDEESAADFISHLASPSDSLTNFVQSIVVLLSSPNRAITTAAMTMLHNLTLGCSAKEFLALVKADIIPQLVISLNPLSISVPDYEIIHTYLMGTIFNSVWLPTPNGLRQLDIKDRNEEQAVQETIFQQVLVPSEQYIWHLCVNRFSIIDGEQSRQFMTLLTRLFGISPYYQPTMDFILHMPIVLTIPSCLTFFETDEQISSVLSYLVFAQRDWNKKGGEVRQIWKTVHRMLRMEGIEDVIEEKLRNNRFGELGHWIVYYSKEWNIMLGMNVPKQK